MRQLPASRLPQQLILRHVDACPARKPKHNSIVFCLDRCAEVDRNTKTQRERQLLLDSVRGVHILADIALLVSVGFPHQVPSVARRVDQDIVRPLFHAALDHRLEILVVCLIFLKGQVIHIDDEAVIPVLDLRDDVDQILELMTVNLDDPQSSVIVFVQNRADRGGLSGPCIPEQQAVVCLASFKKGLRVFPQLLFLDLIPHQVIEPDVGDVRDRNDLTLCLPLAMDHTERLVEPELPASEVMIEGIQVGFEFLRCLRCRKPSGQRLDPVPNPPAVQSSVIIRLDIVPDQAVQRDAQPFFNICEIIAEILHQDADIMQRRLVDTAVHCSPDLTGSRVGILVVDQNPRQAGLPEIA